MKVAFIDTRSSKSNTGVGGYRGSVFSRLSERQISDSIDIERISKSSKYRKIIWSFSKSAIDKDLVHHEPDIMWYPGNLLRRDLKTITTIHGVYPLIYPSLCPYSQVLRLKALRFLSRWIDGIITVSNSERRLISKHLDYPRDSIYVTYNGNNFAPINGLNIKSKSRNNEKYVLHVSNSSSLEGRKNPKLLLDSFARLYSLRNDIQLVIVGNGWNSASITEYITRIDIKDSVQRVGSVDSDRLPRFYKNAEVYLQTSLWESFGMPVIEAMNFGVPVVSTRAYALEEVAKDVPFFVEPCPEIIAKKINHVVDIKNEIGNKLRKGIKVAKSYTWEKTANATMQAYRSVLNK